MFRNEIYILTKFHSALLVPAGGSCQSCVGGNQRQTVNGSVYESCVPCDCSARAETVPAECVPSSGECLNCRNGTTGFHCEECSPHVEGADCDTCMDTFWGLGAQGCSRKDDSFLIKK